MIGQIEATVLVIVVNLLVFSVLDLRLGEIFSFWNNVLLGLAFLKTLAHLNLFYYYIYLIQTMNRF